MDSMDFNSVIKARHGTMLFNRHDVYVGRSIQRYGEYSELELQFLLRAVRRGDVVIEIGANIGAHTVPLAERVGEAGRVLAFEPQRIVFQSLCANLALNSITNTFCFNCALSDRDGELSVPSADYSRQGNFGGISMREPGQGETVPAYRLDTVCTLPRIRMIKIDVEGMEVEVIRGAEQTIRRHKPILYVENDRVDRSAELIGLIGSLGYRMYWHRPPLFNPDNYFQEEENLFPNIVSVNMLCLDEAHGGIDGLREVEGTEYHPLAGRTG